MSTPLKRCSKCQRDLPATTEYFHKNRYNKDGFQFLCKECRGRKFGKSRQWSMAPEGLKRCAYCKTEFPSTLDYFHGNRANHDGLSTACKQCGTKIAKQYNESNPEVARAAKRKYNKSDKGKENQQQWIKGNPKKKKAIALKYVKANREKINKTGREWYAKNKERSRFNSKRWREANADRLNWLRELWDALNPEALKAKVARRRAKKLAADGNYTADDVKRIYSNQGGKCAYCQCEVGQKYHVDHIVPLSRGGSNWPSNLAIACPSCNSAKSDRLLYTEWTPPNPL